MLLTRHQALLEEYPEYSPEWGCADCKQKKKELDDNEDFLHYLRQELEMIVFHLSNNAAYFDYNDVNCRLGGLCQDIGIEYHAVTVARNPACIKREAN